MTDWRVALIIAMGRRCQWVDPKTGKQCEETEIKRLQLHHLTEGEPLGGGRDRRIEIREWRRTGKLPENEEVRCDKHHKVENVKGNLTRTEQWLLRLKTEGKEVPIVKDGERAIPIIKDDGEVGYF